MFLLFDRTAGNQAGDVVPGSSLFSSTRKQIARSAVWSARVEVVPPPRAQSVVTRARATPLVLRHSRVDHERIGTKEENMSGAVVRYRIEFTLAIVSAFPFVLTLITREWIEIVFGVEPDAGSGALEWAITLAVSWRPFRCSRLARRDRRRALHARRMTAIRTWSGFALARTSGAAPHSSLPFANRILRPQSNAPRTVVAPAASTSLDNGRRSPRKLLRAVTAEFDASRAVADLLSQRRLERVGGVLAPAFRLAARRRE